MMTFELKSKKLNYKSKKLCKTSQSFRNIGGDHLLNTTQPTRTPTNPTEAQVRSNLHSRSHVKSPDISIVIREELDGGTKRFIRGFWSAISIRGDESNSSNAVGMQSAGSTTSTWATPPKKSVMRVLSRGRLNRSLRTPWWELIFVTSIESNWEEG